MIVNKKPLGAIVDTLHHRRVNRRVTGPDHGDGTRTVASNDHDGTVGTSRPTRRTFLLAGGAAGVALLAGCGGPSTGGDPTIENLEVTQAIQYLNNPSEPDNSLPLVRGKRAFVRVYVDVSGGSMSKIDGQLQVSVDGTTHDDSPFDSVNGPITVPESIDREETDHTLNFQFLVPETGYGSGAVDVDFEVEVTHDGSVVDTMTLTDVTFECHRSPSIAYIPIDYTWDGADPSSSGLPDSSTIRPGIGDDFIWHTYPIPESPNYYQASTSPIVWDEDVDSSASDLLTDLETAQTMLTPEPDFVYGWFAGNPYWGNGRAAGIGTGSAAFGNTENSRYQRTFAHEIGHLLGLYHSDGWNTISPEVGFYSGYPVHEIRTDDCDTSGSERTKCDTLADVMVPGNLTNEAWIDPQTYTHLSNKSVISDHSCPVVRFPTIPITEYLFVTGTIARNQQVGSHALKPVYRLEGPKELTEDNPDGTRRIELRDEAGEVLLERNFEVSFHGNDSEEPLDEAHFALALPADVNGAVASVVLVSEREDVARIERSPRPPEVEIETPEPGQVLDGEAVPVRWNAFDEDGDPLQFSLQYSPDDGETFVPLTVNISETGFDLNTAEVPGSEEGAGLLRVIATDGFNTTVREVPGLTVPDRKPPTVHISEPKLHGEDEQEEPLEIDSGTLILSGQGYDMEDGFLPAESLLWESSVDGKLGTGRTIQADLSEGEHVVTLTGVDSDENAVEDSVTVIVRE